MLKFNLSIAAAAAIMLSVGCAHNAVRPAPAPAKPSTALPQERVMDCPAPPACPECYACKRVEEETCQVISGVASDAEVISGAAVHFDVDSAEVNGPAIEALEKNLGLIDDDKTVFILVEGHTDKSGSMPHNMGLSLNRAKAVGEYYLAIGVDGWRIWITTFGDAQQICTEDSDECKARNRRVETRILRNK